MFESRRGRQILPFAAAFYPNAASPTPASQTGRPVTEQEFESSDAATAPRPQFSHSTKRGANPKAVSRLGPCRRPICVLISDLLRAHMAQNLTFPLPQSDEGQGFTKTEREAASSGLQGLRGDLRQTLMSQTRLVHNWKYM